MKKLVLMLFAMTAALTVAAQAPNALFNKYDEMDNVKSVYISKAMLSMNPHVINGNLVISKVAGKLDAIYIISTYDAQVKKGLKADLDNMIRKGNYELLMKQKGNSSSSAFYIRKKGDKVSDLIMIVSGAKEAYTHLIGEMDFEDIQQIALINGYSDLMVPDTHFQFNWSEKDFQKMMENLPYGIKDLDNLKDDIQNKFKDWKGFEEMKKPQPAT